MNTIANKLEIVETRREIRRVVFWVNQAWTMISAALVVTGAVFLFGEFTGTGLCLVVGCLSVSVVLGGLFHRDVHLNGKPSSVFITGRLGGRRRMLIAGQLLALGVGCGGLASYGVYGHALPPWLG